MTTPPLISPIQSVTVHYAGEMVAGIRAATYELTTFIDPTNYEPEELRLELANTRRAISRLYSNMIGDTPSWVHFDFEIAARAERDTSDEAARRT